MYIPTTKDEIKALRWEQLDIILVSGDTYVDSPFDGIVVIGKTLIEAGYKVGIIAQPDYKSSVDIIRLGEPRLFWGISAGCVDSMVANYTALKKKKRSDDLTPGEINNRRPDRASIVYTNLIKENFKNTKPIILGGIEASLRRIAHYDYWSDSVRRSIIFDAKADIIVYGMGEKTILEIADCLNNDKDWSNVRGIGYIAKESNNDFITLPSYEEVKDNKIKFIEMFNTFYKQKEPIPAQGLNQKHGNQWLIQNPPNYSPTQKELDIIYDIKYERDVHPYYKKKGKVKAIETIQFSIVSHRGCFGECNFCSIAVHQGKLIQSRSSNSIIKEAEFISKLPTFKGYITDVGGPTANMYMTHCKSSNNEKCHKSCLFPQNCKNLDFSHNEQIELLKQIRKIKGVKKVFISSGIRFDLVMADKYFGLDYLNEIVEHHTSGQLKIAPEHTQNNVLKKMAKPSNKELIEFKVEFYKATKKIGKPQFLTYYFIAGHPGCRLDDMFKLKDFIKSELKIHPEQIQIFTPTPSTYSTLMYYTELDPFTLEKIFVEKDLKNKLKQKEAITL